VTPSPAIQSRPEQLFLELTSALMNNPGRIAWQRTGFRAAVGACADQEVLEIGCGLGAGAGRILDHFGARHVTALDCSALQIELARARHQARYRDRVTFVAGEATKLPFLPARFDSVFALGVLHDIVAWRAVLGEIQRVLRPGGHFYFEEPFVPNILHFPRLLHWHERTSAAVGLPHPHITAAQFVAACEALGMHVAMPLWRFGIIGVGMATKSS
jgi:ubiquinone/menaquinone biosynthesis C-methylase UbiE